MVRVQTSVQRRMVSLGWQTVERFSHLVHRDQRQRTSLQCRQQATMLPSKSDGAFLTGQRHSKSISWPAIRRHGNAICITSFAGKKLPARHSIWFGVTSNSSTGNGSFQATGAGEVDSWHAKAQPVWSRLLSRSDGFAAVAFISTTARLSLPGSALCVTHFAASLLGATFAEISKTVFTRRRPKPVGTRLPLHSPSERSTNSRDDWQDRIREIAWQLSLPAKCAQDQCLRRCKILDRRER